MDQCLGGIACEICLGWVLLLFVDTAVGPRYPLAPQPCPPGPLTPSRPVGPGVLMGSALEGLRLHARKSSPCGQVLWSGVIVLCPSGWVMR